MSVTTEQLLMCGTTYQYFTPVTREYNTARYYGGFAGSKEQVYCYKGFDLIFFEESQFLIIRVGDSILYQGYCFSLAYFLMLMPNIMGTGMFNALSDAEDIVRILS